VFILPQLVKRSKTPLRHRTQNLVSA